MKKFLILLFIGGLIYYFHPDFTEHKTMLRSIKETINADEKNNCFVCEYELEWSTNYTAEEMYRNFVKKFKDDVKDKKWFNAKHSLSFETEGKEAKTTYRLYLNDNRFKLIAYRTDYFAYKYYKKYGTKKNPFTEHNLKVPKLEMIKYANYLMY